MRPKTLFLIAIVALTLMRAAVVWLSQPSASETYFFLCAQHPDVAYFDGPAGTAMLVKLLDQTEFWRMWAPVFALAASLACFALVRQVYDENRAAWVALALNAVPIFNWCALRVRPDLPALTFVLLGLLLAWRAFHTEKGTLWRWFLAGVFFGAASLFAYASILVAAGAALFTFCSPKHRRGKDVAGVIVLLGIPLVLLLPALVWNMKLDWIPLARGTFRTLWNFDLAGFCYSAARLFDKFSLLLLPGLLAAFASALAASRRQLRLRFIALATLPPVFLAVYFTLRGEDAVFYLLLATPLLLAAFLDWMAEVTWRKLLVRVAFALAVLFSAKSAMGAYLAGTSWDRVYAGVLAVFEEEINKGREGLFLIGGDPPVASVLGYYLRKDFLAPEGYPLVFVGESQNISNQFGLWPSYADFLETGKPPADEYFTEQKGENAYIGRDALYITREQADEVPQTIKAAFESVTYLGQFPPPGNENERLYIYLCVNYQTLPL